ncbi:Rho guanine nucleotide exchange factor 38 [Sciurus carolinensis]|uniref:Rho guanine nucleotide exchange factor 38 n=1 Tax=Sciurus carolinensis TaxID=30640 RepID=A0AA41T760_SCICA|nr:Rho guanine nucleotide exchange factor 38 [Sciurus carolinensis]
MDPKEATGKENMGTKRKNLTFLRPRMYMLERRKTDTVVENSVSGDHSGTLWRSQSDRTEYNQKLQEKMTPQAECSATETPTPEEEHQRRKMMAKRAKIIKELIQTEKDYLNDLELCVREVVQPLRHKQIDRLDVESLFSNIESVHQISAKLLSLLEEATTDVEPATQVIVLKYKKNDEDESLKDKLSKLNIHSISKKSKRVTNHLKILTRGESQDALPIALQGVRELQEISYNKDEEERGSSETLSNASNPCHDFASHLQRLVLNPLSALLSLFPGPQKLIQKRYDKLLDYNSYLQRSAGDESDLAKKEYEALNAQLVEELQVFNQAAREILLNCLCSLITLLRDLMFAAQRTYSTVVLAPLLVSSISEIQNRVLEEVHNLNFVKDNSATFIERKLSFEKKKPVQILPEVPRQTDTHRSKLLSTYSAEELYQAKRKCNATQEYDINLLEGELVAVMEQKDPLGSTSRWLVDTGIVKGYVYSSFLKPYNPAKVQKADAENRFCDDDFDNISLFVSSRPASDSVTGTPEGSISDSSSSLSGTCGKFETNGTDVDSFQEVDEQIFYAVHAFQARSDHELSLQEYQRVHILRFCDLSGNKEWWLAETQGQKGYVPANYLGKMTYA